MRAELQRERIRALFFRPGSVPSVVEAPPPPVQLASASAVLVCGPAGRPRAEVMAVVQAWALLGDRTLNESASELHWKSNAHHLALESLRGRLGLGSVSNGVNQAASPSAACKMAESDKAVASEVVVRSHDGDEAAITNDSECATHKVAGAGYSNDASQEAAPVADVPPAERQPQWRYSCHKCSTTLFHDFNVLPHSTDGAKKAGWNWRARLPDDKEETECSSMFVEPMQWMGELEGQTGKLVCGNARCRQKLGGFSWHGLPCSCGQWQSPAFQIHCARIDCLPTDARRLRGPAPLPVFKA